MLPTGGWLLYPSKGSKAPQGAKPRSKWGAPSNSVAIFCRASKMLVEADTLQKAKELKSLALTAADWARRKGMGEEAIQHCRSYAMEAERKMGEMLIAGKESGEVAKKGRPENVTAGDIFQLAELGLTKNESARARGTG